MSLFNRKKREDDGDQVRLTSADHSWWTGAEVDGDHDQDPLLATGAVPVVEPEAEPEELDEVTEPPPPADDLMSGIAQALSDYAYGGPDQTPAEAGYDLEPAVDRAPGADWALPASGSDPGAEVEEILFLHDGLPAEDYLSELLGTLGLEGDADWVDIARAHRRMASAGSGGRGDLEGDRHRRDANEAYARLRLFHH
jgi:hypothetical protein